MAYCYSYMLSLLFLLLITHWTDTASLRFPVYSTQHRRNSSMMRSDYFKSESIHPQLPLLKRLRRWTINGDNDEVEIPLNDSVLSVNNSDDNSSSSILENSTLLNFKTTESNSSVTENGGFHVNMTTAEIQSDENTTIKYPLLRLDLTELNETNDRTTMSIIDEVLQDNNTTVSSTISETFVRNITDINQVVITDKNESVTDNLSTGFESSSSSAAIILKRITDQVEPTSTIMPSDHTTMFYNATEDNQTNGWGLLFNDKTETFSFNDLSTITLDNETISNSNISQKDAIITINQEIPVNDTGMIIIEESPILSSTIPICDFTCLCSKECPYGFEILNDTCLCNPPCKNYQCFGNDTCIVTDKGQPLCQLENRTEYDRPTRCYQPRDAGYHDVNMRYYNRWYYNPDQDTCHLFVYRGLGGNENNFRTLHECHSECITCGPLPDPGECLGRIRMWYYDNKKNECRQFDYSGCKGNDNQFLKKEQCVDTCINRINDLK